MSKDKLFFFLKQQRNEGVSVLFIFYNDRFEYPYPLFQGSKVTSH